MAVAVSARHREFGSHHGVRVPGEVEADLAMAPRLQGDGLKYAGIHHDVADLRGFRGPFAELRRGTHGLARLAELTQVGEFEGEYPVADVWPCHHLIDPDVARAGLGPDGTRDLAPLSSGVLVDDLPAGCNRDAHGSPRVHGLRRKASRRRQRTA